MTTTKNGKKLTRKTEDYLEAILNVTLEKGYARTKDIADLLSVSPPSVVEMFHKLKSMDLVIYRKYEGVRLTEEGERIAGVVKYRHDTLRSFLVLIHVPEDIADRDACILEHELEDVTIGQIKLIVEFLASRFYQPDTNQMFKRFCEAQKIQHEIAG